MKFSLSHVVGLVFLSGVKAECHSIASSIPACAQACFLQGATMVGCGATDFGCQCGLQAQLFAAAEGCVASSCPQVYYQPVIDGVQAVCDCTSKEVSVMGAASAASSLPPMPVATGRPHATPKSSSSTNFKPVSGLSFCLVVATLATVFV